MSALVWTLLVMPAAAQETGDVFVTLVDGNVGTIYLDGNETGMQTPATLREIAPGQHQVQVRGDCMVANATVDVAPGRIARTEMKMSSVGGFLMLEIDPPEATVFLDGEKLGTGPSMGIEADCGDHVLEAVMEGLAPEKRTIRVEMGSAQTLVFDLQEAGFGTLSLMVEPVSAELFLDGRSVAIGPIEVSDVSKGEHTVGAILDGYEPLEKKVTVRAGEVARLDLVLTPAEGGKPVEEAQASEETQAETPKSEEVDQPTAATQPRPKKAGRGKRILIGTASAVASGVGTGFVLTAYRNYTQHYVPGTYSCSDDANCQAQWDEYHQDGIRLYQYIGYGLIGAGAVGLGTTGLMVVLAEDGTPIVGITRRW